jgi:hypothetical protein
LLVVFAIALGVALGGPVATWAGQEAGPGSAQHRPGKGGALVAIDVLLRPDAALSRQAIAINERLRADYPAGYPLGDEQLPHVTLTQLIVHDSALAELYVVVAQALGTGPSPLAIPLTAISIDGVYADGVGLAAIEIERSPDLQVLHEQIVQAVGRFGVQGGTTAAFSTTASLPTVADIWVRYAESFIGQSSGQRYDPHVTLGVAHEAFIRQLAAEPFTPFTSRAAAVEVRQLGDFGTAQRLLWAWDQR